MTETPLARGVTLSHIAIEVADIDASAAFYQRVLGMEVVTVDRTGTPAQFKGLVGDLLIEIVALPPGADGDALAQARRASPTMWLCIAVEDARVAYAALSAHGVRLQGPPKSSNGATYFQFRDPDGYLVELIELPGTARSLGEVMVARAAARSLHGQD